MALEGSAGSKRLRHAGHSKSGPSPGGLNDSRPCAVCSTAGARNTTDTVLAPLGVSITSRRDPHFGQRTLAVASSCCVLVCSREAGLAPPALGVSATDGIVRQPISSIGTPEWVVIAAFRL